MSREKPLPLKMIFDCFHAQVQSDQVERQDWAPKWTTESWKCDRVFICVFQAYLSNMSSNYSDWIAKMLETEARDWSRQVLPDEDGDGYYHTQADVIIFQVILAFIRSNSLKLNN